MRVIKAAAPFQPMDLTCPTCHTTMQAERPNDFQRVSGCDQRDGDSWDYAQASCPVCKRWFRVAKDRFPPHIYDEIPMKK